MPLEVTLLPALQDNYIHLIHDPDTHFTVAIDPTLAAPVLETIEAKGWKLDAILCTHHHGDHVGGNKELTARTGCRVYGFEGDAHRIPCMTHPLKEHQELQTGSVSFHVLWIPGHTLGHIAYWSEKENIVFTGDTLFSMGCGRLFEGTAAQMHASLQKLGALPAHTRVYCGHEYTEANGRFALSVEPSNVALTRRISDVSAIRSKNLPSLPSTIALERATNPFLRLESREICESLGNENLPMTERFARLRAKKDVF